MSNPPPADPVAFRKADTAFRTIGEVSTALGVPQHVLRYWETRFPQVKPLQRAGNRRYYRPADVLLLQKIQRLLEREGYSIRGVQKLLSDPLATEPQPLAPVAMDDPAPEKSIRDELIAIRLLLVTSLARDGMSDANHGELPSK